MSILSRRHASGLLFAGFLFAGLLLASIAAPRSAWAVSVSGSTYAIDTSGSIPDPASSAYSLGDPVTISGSTRSDVTRAHAQAWGSSKVTINGVVKSASGRSWYDTALPGFDAKAFTWVSYAYGTQLIVTGPTPNVDLQLLIPGTNTLPVAFDDGFNPTFNTVGSPPTNISSRMTKPLQNMYTDNTGLGANAPSFFDVFVRLDASVTQGGNPVGADFHGSATLKPQEAGGLTTDSGFAGVFGTSFDANSGRITAVVPNDKVVATYTVKTGTVFDAKVAAYATMGGPTDPNASGSPPVGPAALPASTLDALGGAGSFIAYLLVPQGYQVTAVPEPATLVTASIGALLVAAGVWRKRRRGKFNDE